MKTRLLLLALLLLCLRSYSQQQILYQNTQNKAYLLSYSTAADENQRVINEMLDAIATYIPKPVYQTKVTFNVEENVKIARLKNVVSIYVTHQNITFTGDYYYKAFDMSDVMVPSKYEMTGTLSRGKGLFLADFVQPKTDFKYPYSELVFQYTDTAANSTYVFEVKTTTYYFDNTTRNRFRDKATLIDQYYIADADLNDLNNLLKTVNPDDFENIDKVQNVMNDYQGRIRNIEQAGFWQALHVEMYDPVKLYSKLYSVRAYHQSIQDQMNKTLSIIHELYYNKALGFYNNNRKSDARYNFERSLSYHPQYAPSQYYLALISFEEKKYDQSKQDLLKLFTFKNIDNNTLGASRNLAKALEWTDINKAADLLNKGQFTEALKALEPAESFCRNIPNYTCNDTIELIRGDCHKGIYGKMLTTADQSFKLGKLDQAEKEINDAIDYQQKQSKYITDGKAGLDLKEKIMIEQYYASMKRGREKMAAKDYRAAFNEFNKAADIQQSYPVKKDAELSSLLKKSKLEVLLLDLNQAEQFVATNDLSAARNILTRVIDEQSVYGLNDNAGLNQKIENIKKSIFTQECKNAQAAYDKKIQEAAESVNKREFIKAESAYQAALKITQDNRDCGINTKLADEGLAYTKDPAEYERQLNHCNDLVSRVLYKDAIESYNKLTAFHKEKDLDRAGITHKPLHDYINSQESGFLLYGVEYLANSGDYDNAHYLLKQLRLRNFDKKKTKLQQQLLGRQLAIRDKHKDPAMNPKTAVLEYTTGDKWYGYFASAYIKQAKKMK